MSPDPNPAGLPLRHASARLRFTPALAALLILVALFALNVVVTPNFATVTIRDGRAYGAIVDVFKNGAPVMLLATGMTLVIATGGIDLSVGSLMAIAGAVATLLMTEHDAPVPLAILAAAAACAALGLWNGFLVTYVGLQPIIATLVLLVAGRGIAQALTHDQKISFAVPSFQYLGTGSLAGIPVPIVVAVVLAIVVLLLLRKTVLGLYVEAIGGNARAARLCGIRVHAIHLVVYAFSGLCAAVAGLIVTANIKQADVAGCGLYLELDAILAVVLGGTSLTGGRPHLLGALLGALIMQTLTIMLQMHNVITEHTLVIKAIVAIVVCFVQTPAFARVVGRVRRRSARPARDRGGGYA